MLGPMQIRSVERNDVIKQVALQLSVRSNYRLIRRQVYNYIAFYNPKRRFNVLESMEIKIKIVVVLFQMIAALIGLYY